MLSLQATTMYRFAAISLLFFISCTAPTRMTSISYTSETKPLYAVDPPPQKILLLNFYDVTTKKYRDNKEELFQQMIDSMMQWAGTKIQDRSTIKTKVIPGYTDAKGNEDSTVYALIARHKASHAIAVNYFDVYFEQTHVDVTRDDDGSKSRTANYDIIAFINYSLYDTASLIKRREIHKSEYHSSRNVISGLLASGPNMVAKKNDAYQMAIQLWREYLSWYFPGEKQHNRPVFTGKGFDEVYQALKRNDYEAAMIESLRFVDDPDKNKAAKANYNCAVFMERKSQPDEAKKYLDRSLSLAMLSEARYMREDMERQ